MLKRIYFLYAAIIVNTTFTLKASNENLSLENYHQVENTANKNSTKTISGINDNLTFKPGSYLISTNNGIMEVDLAQESHQLYNDSNIAYKHLRKQGNTIFLLQEYPNEISVLDLSDETITPLTDNIDGEKYDIINDRLVVAKDDYCGGHYVVFIASGNTFSSNAECEERWTSLISENNQIFVSQYSQQSIRDGIAPGFSVSNLNETGKFFIKDTDGGYWVVGINGVFNKYDTNFNLVGTYTTGGLNIKHLSIREDGLILAEEYNRIFVLKPDYHLKKQIPIYIYSSDSSGTFLNGIQVDEDNDLLPLWFEEFYGLDPQSDLDANLDGDNDGLTNLEEYQFKTFPNDADSDDDGLNDGLENTIGTDPHDPDSDDDGLTDGIEYEDLNSNPLSSDTDGDGIDDLTEFQLGLDLNVSNVGVDTDGDGIDDLDEINLGTSPINDDSDSDDLLDGEELTLNTNPLDADTDDDNLNDGAEVYIHSTDPLEVDSDNDSIEDGVEVLTIGSNPLSDDTDSDQMPDGWEYTYGLDLLLNDGADDLDLDSLNNLNEYLLGGNPTVQDTDSDGLTDGEEFILGSMVNNRDSDGDHMPDGWEYLNSTDLLVADADVDNDSDTFNNGIEYWNRTDANDALDYPTAQEWSTFQGNNKHTGYQPLDFVTFAPQPLTTIDLTNENLNQLNPATMNDQMVFLTYQDNLVAYSRNSGSEVWRQVFQVHSTNPPAIDGNAVYLQTGNHGGATHIRSYDVDNGQLNFQSPHGAQWERYLAPTFDKENVYINGGTYGGAYAFDKVTGQQKWFAGSFRQFDMWTPSLDANFVYGYTYGLLIAVDKNTGELEFELNDPSFDWHGYSTNRAVIIGGYDTAIVSDQRNSTGHITVFDRVTQELLWTKILDYKEQLVASNGILFTQSRANVIYALEERTGNVLWNYTLPLGDSLQYNLIVTNQYLIASGVNQTYFINIETHELDFTIPFTGDKELSPQAELLFTADNGEVRIYQLLNDLIFENNFE